MKEILFVVNPNAASGRAASVWDSLLRHDQNLRYAAVVRDPGSARAMELFRSALTPKIRRVIVLGGDGTLHRAVNLLVDDQERNDRCIGLIPVGTGSDLARGLGLHNDPALALRAALESTPRPMDLLRLEADGGSRYLINVASLGLSAHVVSHVNNLPKRSTLTFLTAALGALFKHPPIWARISLDGEFWREGRFYLAAVANSSCFANGMRIAPHADPRDGYADVVLVEAVARMSVLRWLPTVYFGKHLTARFIHWQRARTIEFETGEVHPIFEGDGELMLPAPGRITVVPNAIQFCGAE